MEHTAPLKHRSRLILILGLLTALCPFSIDMYLPAFLQIADAFGVPVARMSLSLSGFFVGLAAGQLFYGPLVDRFGRKRPLYAALAIYTVTAVGCAIAKSIDTLIVFRFLQAIGGCGVNVVAMALVRDYFTGKESTKVFSLLILILAISPLFAPTFGGFLTHAWGWRSIFFVLAAISGALGLAAYFFLPAGNPPDAAHPLRPLPILQGYLAIAKNPAFMTYALAGSWSLCGLFMYVSSSPIIFLQIFRVSPTTYGWLFGCMAIGFVGSSQFNFLLLKQFTTGQILRAGLIGMAGVGLIFFGVTAAGWGGLKTTMLLLFFYLAFFGISNPNAATLALTPFSKNAGSASALMGFLQMAIGAIASISIGLFKTTGLTPLAAMFAASSCLALATFLIGSRSIVEPHPDPATSEIPPVILE